MLGHDETLRILAAVVMFCGVPLTPTSVLATCGDGIPTADEQCDDGAGNGHDACCSSTCQVVDSDYDGTCDAIDPCPSGQGTRIKESRLSIMRLATAPGDDTLRLVGRVTVPSSPAIDPAISGMRLRMFAPGGDVGGSPIVDVSLPGGPPWRRRAKDWTYQDRTGALGGIDRVKIKLVPPLVPTTRLTTLVFAITGRRGSYAVTPEMVTSEIVDGIPEGSALQVTLAVGALGSSSGQCGEAWYTTALPTHCQFSSSGDRVTCAGPRPVGPCHIGDPDDLVMCDVLNAARAEERYYAAHGAYYTGPCSGLRGFEPSPEVVCTAGLAATSFTVTTTHPDTARTCTWSGETSPVAQNLTCSY